MKKFFRILGFAVLFLVLVFAIASNINMILGHFDRQDNPISREIKTHYELKSFGGSVFLIFLRDCK